MLRYTDVSIKKDALKTQTEIMAAILGDIKEKRKTLNNIQNNLLRLNQLSYFEVPPEEKTDISDLLSMYHAFKQDYLNRPEEQDAVE